MLTNKFGTGRAKNRGQMTHQEPEKGSQEEPDFLENPRVFPEWTQELTLEQRHRIHELLQMLDLDLKACYKGKEPDPDEPELSDNSNEDFAISVCKDETWQQMEDMLQETNPDALNEMKYELWECVQSVSSPYPNLVEYFDGGPRR